jgi:hypothetical protein
MDIVEFAPSSADAGDRRRRRDAPLGTAVFFGMLGVTFFGLLFTPVFYVACRRLALLRQSREGRRVELDGAAAD